MFLILVVMALSLSPTSVDTDGTQAPTTVGQTDAWIEAEANRSKIKVSPSFLSGPQAELPESEKAQGHHGRVIVQGIIGVDGKMKEARIKMTSGAASIDEIALSAAIASTFVPAKDEKGTPLSVVIAMPFDLVAYKSTDEIGILKYKCAQFTRDMDWWKSVNPEKPFKDHELYRMELGLIVLSMSQQSPSIQGSLSKSISDFENRWKSAIELCRKKPNMLQRDAIFR